MRLLKALRAVPLLLGLMTSPLLDHHSVTKEFDQTRATNIEGIFTKVEWMNPHAWITKSTSGPIREPGFDTIPLSSGQSENRDEH